jgi:hypothetical protein
MRLGVRRLKIKMQDQINLWLSLLPEKDEDKKLVDKLAKRDNRRLDEDSGEGY